jgi:gliding motility-associated-like protein
MWNFGSAQSADFSALPTTICVGGTVQFTNLSTGATTYTWTFLDGGTNPSSSLVNPTYTYPNPGVFTVVLTAAAGPSSTDTEVKSGYITVLAAATATLTSGVGSDNQIVCANDPITTITYAIAGATGATFSGLPPGTGGVFTPSPSGGTVTISGTPTSTGVFNYSFTTSGVSCGPITVNGTITVDPPPTLALTSGNPSPTVCLNQAISTITYAFGGSATGATVTGLPAGLMSNISGGTLTISGTPSAIGTFPYTVSTTGGGCPPESLSGTITVEPQHTLTLTSGSTTQTVCANDSIGAIVYTVGGSATGATVSGLPAGVNGVFNAGSFTISGTTPTPGSYSYTVTTTGGSCTPVSLTGTINFSTPPTLTLTSAPSTANQIVCVGTPIDDVTIMIGGSATGATVSGLPVGVTSSFSGSTLTITGVPSSTGTFNYTVSSTGGPCAPATFSGVINVDPDINLISAPGTDNQTICQDSLLVTIVYSVGAGITGATVTGLPAGIVGNYSPGNFIISGIGSTIGVSNYTVTTTGGSCGPASASGTITVTGGPTLDLLTIGNEIQTLCETSPILNIDYQVGGTATGAVATGLPTGLTTVFNLGVFTISGTATQTGIFPYSVTTTGSPCGDSTLTGSISIDELHQITLVSAAASDTQTLCLNSAMDSLIYTFSGGATGANILGLPSGIVFVISNDSIIITGSPDVPGNYPFTVYTTGGTCDADSAFASMFVEDSTSLTLVSAIGTNMQVICEDVFIDSIIYVLNPGADTAIVTGLGTDFTSVFVNDSIIITGMSNTIGIVTYTIVGYGTFCPNDTITGTIEVQSSNMSLSSGATTNDQTVGLGEPIVNIAYLVGGPVVVTDLPPGVVSNYIPGSPNVLTISGTPTQVGSYYYTIQFNGPCGNSLLVGDITVTSTPTVPPTPFDSTIIFVPNLFSPNADGHNDFFEIPSISLYPDTRLKIINREGVLVYTNDNYDNTWDGTYNGDPLPEATYYYVLFVNSVEKVLKGPITILRNEK